MPVDFAVAALQPIVVDLRGFPLLTFLVTDQILVQATSRIRIAPPRVEALLVRSTAPVAAVEIFYSEYASGPRRYQLRTASLRTSGISDRKSGRACCGRRP